MRGTDLQEYLGSSVPDAQGRLAFQEGPLVRALREGHWVVLDELNLAPSDVLEALNRWVSSVSRRMRRGTIACLWGQYVCPGEGGGK